MVAKCRISMDSMRRDFAKSAHETFLQIRNHSIINPYAIRHNHNFS